MRFSSSLGVLLTLVPGLGTLAEARTLTVGKAGTSCPSPAYSTISAAIAAASPHDTIQICPALYPEQLVIAKPLTLQGISVTTANGVVDRVLIRPAVLTDVAQLQALAVITLTNTKDVTIDNLAVDAGSNTVTGCAPTLSAVHFFNSSGVLENSAVSGARLRNPQSCAAFFGNGFGVLIDTDGSQKGRLEVSVKQNSIHDFTRDGISAAGAGVVVDISGNSISGVGPSLGVSQFGVFVLNGAGASITDNIISEGLCGTLSVDACFAVRSEGVVLRAAADGVLVRDNVIMNAQAGIFLNGGSGYKITNNRISNIDVIAGILMQGAATGSLTGVLVEGNTMFNLTPIANEVCGVSEAPGTGVARNHIVNNTVNDAYCGVAYVSGDQATAGRYFNVLYETLNLDLYPTELPPPTEP